MATHNYLITATVGSRNYIVDHWSIAAESIDDAVEKMAEKSDTFRLAWVNDAYEIIVSRIVKQATTNNQKEGR